MQLSHSTQSWECRTTESTPVTGPEPFLRHQSRPSVWGQVTIASRRASLPESFGCGKPPSPQTTRSGQYRCHGGRPGLLARMFTPHPHSNSLLESVNQLLPADTQHDRPDENGLLIWIHSLENPSDDPSRHGGPPIEGGTPRDAVHRATRAPVRPRNIVSRWSPGDTAREGLVPGNAVPRRQRPTSHAGQRSHRPLRHTRR
jgi:hypothetical protein